MFHMKIEVYPSLRHALESLGHDDFLYTNYSLIENPLTIKYERKASGYKPVRIVKRRTLKEGYGGVIELHESSSRFKYNHFLFRREVFGELAEALASAVDENGKVFMDPLKEAITLGMREINRKDKDFICLGIIPEYSDYYKEEEVKTIEQTSESITIMAMEEESWKEDFLDFGKVREEVESWLKRLFGEDIDTYYWVESVRLVDKELGGGMGRVLARFWEKDRLLGLHSGTLGEMKELIKAIRLLQGRFGNKYVEKVFPELLGNIYLYLKVPKVEELEIVVVPLKLRDSGTKGDKEVDFSVFPKLKLEDIKVEWNAVRLKYELNGSIGAEESSRTTYMRVLSPKEVPVEIPKDRGKTAIFVKSELMEVVEVEKESKYKSRLGHLNKVAYKTKIENPIKSLYIEIGNFPELSVVGYGEVGPGRTTEESIDIDLFLGEDLDPGIKEGGSREGPECLGERAETLIKKEIRDLLETLLDLEKRGQDQEKRDILKLASFVLSEALELLEKENGVNRKCGRWKHSYRSYYYRLHPEIEGDYRPLIERENTLSILSKNLLSPGPVKRVEKIVNFLGQGGGSKACFSSGEERIEISFEEVERKANEREVLYFLLSKVLAKVFRDYIGQVRKTAGEISDLLEKERLKDIDEFSILLSGTILSSIKRFPTTVKDINLLMEKVYVYLFQTMTHSLYKYDKNKGTWVRDLEKPILNVKELVHHSLGTLINLGKIVEEIRVRVPYEYRGGDRELFRLEKRVYLEEKIVGEQVSLYINPGIDDKLVEIGWSLDNDLGIR
jgi:hypothetical protein